MKCIHGVKCTVATVQQVQQYNKNNISNIKKKKKNSKASCCYTGSENLKILCHRTTFYLGFAHRTETGMHENAPEPLNLFIPRFERGFLDFFP